MIPQILKMIWRKRSQNAFLILEIILAFLILFFVFSLVGKYLKTYTQPLGFNYENTAVMTADFDVFDEIRFAYEKDKEGYDTLAYINMKKELRKAMIQVPGVEEVSFTNSVAPYSGSSWSSGDENEEEDLINYERAFLLFSDQYLAEVYDLNLVEGRYFNEDDINGKYLPVVVNQKFVDEYYKGEGSIVGKKLRHWGEVKVVTGVVDHFKYIGEFTKSMPVMFPYISNHEQTAFGQFKYDETKNPNWEADLNTALQNHLKGIDFSFYKQKDARWSMNRRYWAPIVGFLALSTFLVVNVAMGLFGILQYKIKKRRKEIGLRKAIGASFGSITKQFLTEMLLLTLIGLFIGVLFAVQVPLLGLMSSNESNLHIDNESLYQGMALAFAFVLFVVFICSLLPSLQASKIQPAIALHEE